MASNAILYALHLDTFSYGHTHSVPCFTDMSCISEQQQLTVQIEFSAILPKAVEW